MHAQYVFATKFLYVDISPVSGRALRLLDSESWPDIPVRFDLYRCTPTRGQSSRDILRRDSRSSHDDVHSRSQPNCALKLTWKDVCMNCAALMRGDTLARSGILEQWNYHRARVHCAGRVAKGMLPLDCVSLSFCPPFQET